MAQKRNSTRRAPLDIRRMINALTLDPDSRLHPALIPRLAEEGMLDARALGADTARANNRGHTPAMLAALDGHSDCLRALVHAGVELGCRDARGHSAAMIATVRGHVDCVAILLLAGADMSLPDHIGRTALDIIRIRGQEARMLQSGTPASAARASGPQSRAWTLP